MAFQLKRSKAIGNELARIVMSEVRKASREMAERSPGEESVHEARTHVKKVRSVLRLLRKPLGNDYVRLDESTRSAAHQLSATRDADALAGALDSLRRRYHDVFAPAALGRANATLDVRRRKAHVRLTGHRLADIRQSLVHSRRDLRSQIQSVATGRTVRRGITRGYRRARQAMNDATGTNTDDVRLHTWRRRLKDHWYHMRLVEGLNGYVHPRVRRLKRLQDWLGEHHNLALLRSAILEQPRQFGEARIVALILGCIDKRQATLRRRATRRGRQLFSRKPSSFRKQINRWWRSPRESS
jgi:CHAD domain-containing protein